MTEDRSAQARFGTFGGVFTPCVLTILGVIMFMRSGYVVGDTGIWRALIILAIAKSITTLTTISLSAIATNTEVRAGGVYYMISRTLGPDFGGAIGLTLFVSQAISVAFYVIGFSEALFGLFPAGAHATAQQYHLEQLCSTVVIVGLFLVTFRGADLAIRAQYFILAVLMLSVVSFIVGGLLAFDAGNFNDNMGSHESSVGFWVVFAIFFPAATGITAGANMSGDLKDPGSAIPRGTMLAIGFTGAIYTIQLILMAGFTNSDNLVSDPFGAIQNMSVWGPLVIAGVFAATLSSALGSFLGAPRILQAMGKDRLLRPLVYFGTGYGPSDEPRRATVLTLIIAVCIVWAGGLNAIAEVISMFFLIAYGMINLSAFVEGRGGNPSFRPRFKVAGWPAALVGTIACAIAMFKINETYALVSMVIAGGIYLWLRGRTTADWGDAKRGYVFSRTRENLLTLETMSTDPKNWRPVLAVLTEDAERDFQLIQCASWIESGRGLLSVLELSSGPGTEAGPDGGPHRQLPPSSDASTLPARLDHRSRRMAHIHQFLQNRGVVAFADAVVVENVQERLDIILQAYSLGSLRPNTLMVSVPPPAQIERRKRMSDMLKMLSPFGLNLVIYKGARVDTATVRKRIDVWWHGRRNGSLLALFAYLANTHDDWSEARIRMMRVVTSGAEHLEAEQSLRRMMAAARLAVDVEVVLSQKPISELIPERSGGADLVLMGLADATLQDFGSFLERTDALLARLPPTLLVLSNGEADLLA